MWDYYHLELSKSFPLFKFTDNWKAQTTGNIKKGQNVNSHNSTSFRKCGICKIVQPPEIDIRFQPFEIFQYFFFVHVQVQNMVKNDKNAAKHRNILKKLPQKLQNYGKDMH